MEIRRFIGFLLTASLTLQPLAAVAGEFDDLLEDLRVLEAELSEDERQETYLELNSDFEASEQMFPEEDLPEREQTTIREETISSEHVFIRYQGIPIILEDVPIDSWFAVYVRDMVERGIVSGYKDVDGKPTGQYGPADDVTIEQLAKIAVESAGIDAENCSSEPKNLSASGSWSVAYISCAESLRWTIYSEAIVDVKRPATRTEVVTTVLQAFQREFEPATGDVFEDVSSTMALREAVETAALDGLVSGYTDENGNPTGFFGPQENVNRAETAKIVSLALQIYGAY